jgi:hypothetical protein
MAHAETHVVSIRAMLTNYFNPNNGYRSLQILKAPFWELIPVSER